MCYLQRDSEADLLSVVTEDAPRSAEQHEADPRLLLMDLLLQRHRQTGSNCSQHYGGPWGSVLGPVCLYSGSKVLKCLSGGTYPLHML